MEVASFQSYSNYTTPDRSSDDVDALNCEARSLLADGGLGIPALGGMVSEARPKGPKTWLRLKDKLRAGRISGAYFPCLQVRCCGS